jgi:endoribonuclease Dicer
MAKAHTCKVSDFVARPTEYIKYYDQAPKYDYPRLYLKMLDLQAGCFPQLSRAMTHASTLCAELGPWPAERLLELSIHDAVTKLKYSRFQRQYRDNQSLEEIENIVHELDQYILNSTKLGDDVQPPSVTDISPKVFELLNILETFRSTQNRFCGIVFCRQRWTACVLAMVVKYWGKLDWIRPGVIVGHGSSDSSTMNMSIQGQDDILTKFRNGQINLLFATQVAEEGIDIQSCILVIRFDMFVNLAAYIQSRGRARHKNSIFVALSKKNNPEEASLLACMQLEEANMRKILYDGKNKTDKDLELNGSPIKQDEIFKVETTGSIISVYSALSLLHNYCNTLPNDGYAVSKPEFTESEVTLADENVSEGFQAKKYISKLIMPLNTPAECRTVIGRPSNTKKKARQWTAFEAVQRLFFAGELDDRLRPNRPDRLSIIQNTMKKPKTIEVHECTYRNPILFGNAWDNSVGAILHVISLEDATNIKRDLKVGLLTSSDVPMPAINFDFLMEGREVKTFVRSIKGKIRMTAEKLRLIREFHYNIFSSILRSNFKIDDRFTLLVAPITLENAESDAEDMLDMNLLYSLDREPKNPVNEICKSVDFLNRDFSELVLYDHIHYKRKYFVHRLFDQHTPFSEDIPIKALGKHKSPADYYKFRLKFSGDIIKEQPIFSVVPVTLPYLTVPAVYHDRPDTFVIPQFCVIHPVPASIMRYEAPMLPLILYHLHHNMLALEIQKGWIPKSIQSEPKSNFKKELPVKLNTLRSALTGPCVDLSYDYERLETLGDSFLKMHLALHYFVLHPNRHEGKF